MDNLGLTNLLKRRIIGDLIEVFKIMNEISNYGGHFFNISLQTGNLLSRQISKTMSTNLFLLIEQFREKNQIKNNNSV